MILGWLEAVEPKAARGAGPRVCGHVTRQHTSGSSRSTLTTASALDGEQARAIIFYRAL